MIGINKQYVKSLLKEQIRQDGRKPDEFREIKIEYNVSEKSADGSAKVKLGDTEVIAGVKLEVGEPFPDNPDKGTIIVNSELLPLASPDFELGPPSIGSIELSRVVDRALRESKILDFKKLCIKEGEKVWLVFIDIYPINNAGNLFDACFLAALAALKSTRFPKYDEKNERIIYEERTSKKLPLEKNTPIECTVIKVGDTFLVDPTNEEEEVMDARLTIGILEDKKICAMQKGGDNSLSIEEILKMVDIAAKKIDHIRKAI